MISVIMINSADADMMSESIYVDSGEESQV